jgi:hypothetical protein
MHYLLLLLRLVLDRLFPSWRDGLTMAARADGRVEHIPTRESWWDRWLEFLGQHGPDRRQHGRSVRAKRRAVRANRSAARGPDSKPAE